MILYMRKIFGFKDGVYLSLETDGGETRFYAHREGTPYSKRTEIIPGVLPDNTVLKEILSERLYSDPVSPELGQFIDQLYAFIEKTP